MTELRQQMNNVMRLRGLADRTRETYIACVYGLAKYYTHRVAISNERIVGIDEGQVAFRVRADPGSGKKRTMHLPGPAFIDRFFLRVLPKGFKRIGHYGLLAPAHKTRRLAQARSALAAPTPEPEVVESVAAFMDRVVGIDWARCPACAGHFVVTAVIAQQRLHGPLAHGGP